MDKEPTLYDQVRIAQENLQVQRRRIEQDPDYLIARIALAAAISAYNFSKMEQNV